MYKPRGGMGSDGPSTSPVGAYPAGGGWSNSSTSNRGTGPSGESSLEVLRQLAKGEELGPTYNSDDDPESIVGRSIKVRWNRDEYYKGEGAMSGVSRVVVGLDL